MYQPICVAKTNGQPIPHPPRYGKLWYNTIWTLRDAPEMAVP